MLPPNNSNPLAALYSSLLPAVSTTKTCGNTQLAIGHLKMVLPLVIAFCMLIWPLAARLLLKLGQRTTLLAASAELRSHVQKACNSGKDATDKRHHRGCTKPTGSRTGDVQQLSAIINLEATSTMNGAGRCVWAVCALWCTGFENLTDNGPCIAF